MYKSKKFPPAAGIDPKARKKPVLPIVLRMKTIGKTKKYVLPAAGMKNKTAPPGFTRFFRFAGLLPIGAGFAKRNDGPQCPPQAKKIGIWGAFYTKNTSPPGGSAPAAGGKFLGIWGALYTKITLLGCIQERVSGAKHPPNLKISASGGPKPQKYPMLLHFPEFSSISILPRAKKYIV